jgi:hypothetical protein
VIRNKLELGRSVSIGFRIEMYGGKGGTRTLDPGIMSAAHKRKAA